MIWKMIKEEWRKNSEMYRGRSFAAFPFTILFFSLLWNWSAVNYSTITIETLQNFVYGLTIFLGFAVGAAGFSSRDAFKNILGRTNYLVFTSRTLPVSSKRLITEFVVKDVAYYSMMVLIPLIAGFLIATGLSQIHVIPVAAGLFVASMAVSTLFTATSSGIKVRKFLGYSSERLNPVASKSILDIYRSSGGFMKIIFSVGLLTAFYWVLVLYFPVTDMFLLNPLLSYSVIMGLVGLTVYNWLNRFDELDDYTHLPLDRSDVLKAKKEAFLYTAVPLGVVAVLVSGIFYSDNLILAVSTVASMTIYNMAVAVKVTGLSPNESLFHANKFLEYMIGVSIILVPQLYMSVIYNPQLLLSMTALNIFGVLIGLKVYRE